MSEDYFTADISRQIWEAKYRFRDGDIVHDATIEETWQRMARAAASVEGRAAPYWEKQFYQLLEDFRFLPGGRIQAGSGTGRRVTLFNCFVMGTIADSMDGIFDALKEGALTMQQGGGVGYDFSTLRPAGSAASSVGAVASGPVSFMRIWDAMCGTLLSTGSRRGAMMATLRCDHPDIETFVAAKREHGALRHFNLSVLVSDAFMQAVADDTDWALVFPEAALEPAVSTETVERNWPGYAGPVTCRILRRVPARRLWDQIMRATYEYAEPGVLFIDRINRLNNLWYREFISATNPCGEIPLPPYGACNLGSINLTRFVSAPFSDQAHFDFESLRSTVSCAVRFMDNVIDLSLFPLPAQAEQAKGSRRIGLGVTGLADTLILLGMTYGSTASLDFARSVMDTLRDTAYRASVDLADEKGVFPFLEKEPYLSGEFMQSLPASLRSAVEQHGIRNSHLLAIAPTGTISLLANNVSSGLEPVFDFSYQRRMLGADGQSHTYTLEDYAHRLWRTSRDAQAPLPPSFVDARALSPQVHLDMQAAIQPYVDNAISKTINIPADYAFEDFRTLYERAFEQGLKGCTTFRPNPVTGEVMSSIRAQAADQHCCSIEREAD